MGIFSFVGIFNLRHWRSIIWPNSLLLIFINISHRYPRRLLTNYQNRPWECDPAQPPHLSLSPSFEAEKTTGLVAEPAGVSGGWWWWGFGWGEFVRLGATPQCVDSSLNFWSVAISTPDSCALFFELRLNRFRICCEWNRLHLFNSFIRWFFFCSFFLFLCQLQSMSWGKIVK